MNLYLLSQKDNNGYDTYENCVVCAENEEIAKNIHPSGEEFKGKEGSEYFWEYDDWANTLEGIACELIGTANETQKRGVICASFNAG